MDHRGSPSRRRDSGVGLGTSALRASVTVSPVGALLVTVAGLVLSWLATYLIGGAQYVVPHFYYLPIVFAAVRFGPTVATAVAGVSGLLAGPLTYLDVATATPQEPERWLSRLVFFVVLGLVLSALVRPSLPSIVEEVRRKREEMELHEALERGELFVRYQPVIELATGRLHGVEALVRWQHPERGELAPGAFLPVAERCELINDLGTFVFAAACRQAARWRHLAEERGRTPLTVAVNMSARELGSPTLVERVRDQLVASGVDPKLLCIEVTESTLVADLDVSVARLSGLKTLGVRLAVDDFGTGYSSLASVHRFPIDLLKVDRSFLSDLPQDETTEALLGGLVLFTRSLDLATVAEGVETEEQAQMLRELGYDLAQGYLYARPLLPDEIDAALATERVSGEQRAGPY